MGLKSKLIGYVKGKETFLNKDDMEKCFFCDKLSIPKDFTWERTSEQFDMLRELLGEIPSDVVGKIGNKTICRDCIGDLNILLPFKYEDDD